VNMGHRSTNKCDCKRLQVEGVEEDAEREGIATELPYRFID